MKQRGLLLTCAVIAVLIASYMLFNALFLYTRVGYVNAETVPVSSQVPGEISHIYVKDLQPVRQGQLLLKIDDSAYLAALKLADAKLDEAQKAYATLQEKLSKQQLLIAQTQSQADLLSKKWARYKPLLNQKAVSSEKADEIYTSMVQAQQSLKMMEDTYQLLLKISGKSIEDYAPYQAALSEKNLAVINEARTNIVSTKTGYVTGLRLSIGNYVRVGEPLLSVINDENWWVTANVLENDLRGIQAGDKAYVSIPALDGKIFTTKIYGIGWGVDRQDHILGGNTALPHIPRKVDWIQLEQRFPVRFDFIDLPKGTPLRVGETAHVFLVKHYAKT